MLKDTRNHSKLKDVVRKVIAFMTLGIDVSGLFTEMSMVGSSVSPWKGPKRLSGFF